MNKILRLILVGSLIGLGTIELIARFVLGLGSPPISQRHPTIEYMFQPDQDVNRFGNRFLTNSWGMRSDYFPLRKLEANELRVLIFGDSVLNGGNLTDHEQLATTLIQQELSRRQSRPVTVGNISAGSWGPGNWLAYVNEYGWFDADIVIVEVNHGDGADCPVFGPLNPDSHPIESPWCATQELFSRYLPRYLPKSCQGASESAAYEEKTGDDAVCAAVAREDMRQFLELAKANVNEVHVVKFLDREQTIAQSEQSKFSWIDDLCRELEVNCVSTLGYFDPQQTSFEFRDEIHPNPPGQAGLAKAILTKLFPPIAEAEKKPAAN
jgi:hypothetical protein